MREYEIVLEELIKFLEKHRDRLEDMSEADGYFIDAISDIEYWIEKHTPTAEDLKIMAAEDYSDGERGK